MYKMTKNRPEPEIADRLALVREAAARAAKASGRDPEEVTLIAVSKLHPAEAVEAAALAGQRDFGENYIQEALAKQEALAGRKVLADLKLSWHFIGGLQRNKAKFVPGRFAMIHTLDSLKLAQSLHKRLLEHGGPAQDVLIEVNLAGETQKAGAREADVLGLAEAVTQMPGLALQGLMLMPPFFEDPEDTRPFFARLRKLRDSLETKLAAKLPALSMGMSQDFEQAIREGATHVRIGTRIFGPRPCRINQETRT